MSKQKTMRWFTAAYLGVSFIFIGINQALPSSTNANTVEQQDLPVEQTHKNIQVLKGLPESQLGITMNYIRASLGVSCAHCHLNSGDDKWEWERDDKPAKQTARRHIQMTVDINKANFNGRTVITCNTCHQGKAQPAALPFLPQPPPEGGPGGMTPVVALPTADQIMDKYIQALGGRVALQRIKTRSLKGAQITSDGRMLPLEIYQEAPNKFLSLVTIPQGVIAQGYNGTVGWFKGPRAQRELSGADLAEVRRSAEFNWSLRLKELYPKMSVIGKEKVGAGEAFVIESPGTADTTERLFFDVQTGLLVRVMTLTQTMIGQIPEQTDFEDYREVDGVKMPFTIRHSYVDPWVGWARKFSEIRHNVPVDAARFDRPVNQK